MKIIRISNIIKMINLMIIIVIKTTKINYQMINYKIKYKIMLKV